MDFELMLGQSETMREWTDHVMGGARDTKWERRLQERERRRTRARAKSEWEDLIRGRLT
jgi:hypothetical protein